jgi:hypothetical protein
VCELLAATSQNAAAPYSFSRQSRAHSAESYLHEHVSRRERKKKRREIIRETPGGGGVGGGGVEVVNSSRRKFKKIKTPKR